MAPEIQLGYRINDIELCSTTASSQAASVSTGSSQSRTGDWILTLPSETALNASTKSNPGGKSTNNIPAGWPALPAAILRGPIAEFKSRQGRWIEIPKYAVKNNLLIAAGFLELANACDFAANVFNQIPIPIYAAVLMAIGGLIALVMLYFALEDAKLSWINIKLLRKERYLLKAQLNRAIATNGPRDNHSISIQACLAVNHRELGFEIIDRFLLDSIMGCGCLLVGVGTLMAIGGSNPKVYLASNLLSGYIGNSPAALYGLINAVWSVFIWFRADEHSRICRNDVAVALVWPRLSHRHDTVKLHAAIYGLTGLVAGAGSIMTATLWYGYVMLAPCVVASGWCNWLWRKRVGYGRSIFEEAPPLTRDCLIAELQVITLLQRTITQKTGTKPPNDFDLCYLLEIVQRYDLMAEFCLMLREHEKANQDKFFQEPASGHISIRIEDMLSPGLAHKRQFLVDVLWNVIMHKSHANLVDRERFLLELLGSYFFATDNLGS